MNLKALKRGYSLKTILHLFTVTDNERHLRQMELAATTAIISAYQKQCFLQQLPGQGDSTLSLGFPRSKLFYFCVNLGATL